MPTLPGFIFEILPSLYVAFLRVLGRLDVSVEELFGLFLVCGSDADVDGVRSLLKADFLESLATGMGYADANASALVLSTLIEKGLASEIAQTPAEQARFSESKGQKIAISITTAGEKRFADVIGCLQTATSEFFKDQSAEVSETLDRLFDAATNYQSLAPLLAGAFARKPIKSAQCLEGDIRDASGYVKIKNSR